MRIDAIERSLLEAAAFASDRSLTAEATDRLMRSFPLDAEGRLGIINRYAEMAEETLSNSQRKTLNEAIELLLGSIDKQRQALIELRQKAIFSGICQENARLIGEVR